MFWMENVTFFILSPLLRKAGQRTKLKAQRLDGKHVNLNSNDSC